MPIVLKENDFHDLLISHGFRHRDHRKAGYHEPGMPETYEIDHKDVGHTIKVHHDGSWDHYNRETGALRHVKHGLEFDSMVHHLRTTLR